ncbi:hypothetical protein BGX23_008838 [Mortierella sp. AD031]|nr:hypothetical protein BGX23_008838 [Mortierella sp. AD031]KAG0207371.1 hypothetical protein BGX33_006893 [Mortierella sp. NVP41]
MSRTSNNESAASSTSIQPNPHNLLNPLNPETLANLSGLAFKLSHSPTPPASLSPGVLSLARSLTPVAKWKTSRSVSTVRSRHATISSAGKAGQMWESDHYVPERKGDKKKTQPKFPTVFYDQITGDIYGRGAKLGEGGYGPVFQVVDEKNEKSALKTYWPTTSEEAIDRELDILDMAGCHDNLVKYFGVVDDPTGRCPRFELCLSWDLQDLLNNREKVTEPETRYFGDGIAAGLSHIHGMGLIHCDIKPSNVLIAPGMHVRIGDLGLAKEYGPKITLTGKRGTEGFLAPEMVDGKPFSIPADVFSFGVIMYKMLQGEEPRLTDWDDTYSEELDFLLSRRTCVLSRYAKDLVVRLLDFNPKSRLPLKNLRHQKFFITGHWPKELDESVFDKAPNFATKKNNKRKKISREKADKDEERAQTKAKHDRVPDHVPDHVHAYDDPYVDLSTLYDSGSEHDAKSL